MERRSLQTAMEDIGLMLYTYRVYWKKKTETMARLVEITPAALIRIEKGEDPTVGVALIAELCHHYKIPLFLAFDSF